VVPECDSRNASFTPENKADALPRMMMTPPGVMLRSLGDTSRALGTTSRRAPANEKRTRRSTAPNGRDERSERIFVPSRAYVRVSENNFFEKTCKLLRSSS
jgi:hypothetical protein